MTTFVLVHGGWHGAWCWYRVAPLLERLGHRVLTPDLPGHGRDATPVATVSLHGYADRVTAVLRTATEPVVLVGHSLGGMVITQAAEAMPERVRTLVYLAAFLPANGESLATLVQGDTENLLDPNCTVDESGTLLILREAGLRPALYADCRDEDIALAIRLVRPEPVAPLTEPARTSAGGWGAIPRVYLECLEDRALPLPRQRRMQQAQPCERVLSLRSGHSPFFSIPETLVEYLAAL